MNRRQLFLALAVPVAVGVAPALALLPNKDPETFTIQLPKKGAIGGIVRVIKVKPNQWLMMSEAEMSRIHT
jgi:hypothetical protein